MEHRDDIRVHMPAGASMRLSLDRAREMLRGPRRRSMSIRWPKDKPAPSKPRTADLQLRRDWPALYHGLSATTIAELDALLGGDGVPPDAR